jgi:hypothetical protein
MKLEIKVIISKVQVINSKYIGNPVKFTSDELLNIPLDYTYFDKPCLNQLNIYNR